MRIILTAAAAGSLVALGAPVLPASAADAQYYRDYGYQGNYRSRAIRRAQRECERDLRRADNRWEYRRELRDCRRDLRQARYGGYYGNRGYRDYDYRGNYGRYWDGYRWRNRY